MEGSALIRTEQTHDYQQVKNILLRAFLTDAEARLTEKLRHSEEFIPELSLVAEIDGKLVGHMIITRGYIQDGDKKHGVAALGPLSVNPDNQRTGIGTALVQEGLLRCSKLAISLVFLIGHPSYYPRHGFVQARPYGFELKQFQVDDPVFMVYEALQGALASYQGEFRYSTAFIE